MGNSPGSIITVFYFFQKLSFENTGRSFMKTIVMMIGEFDFDALFNEASYKPPPVTWALFFLFVIVMTILLMNLMVSKASKCIVYA